MNVVFKLCRRSYLARPYCSVSKFHCKYLGVPVEYPGLIMTSTNTYKDLTIFTWKSLNLGHVGVAPAFIPLGKHEAEATKYQE